MILLWKYDDLAVWTSAEKDVTSPALYPLGHDCLMNIITLNPRWTTTFYILVLTKFIFFFTIKASNNSPILKVLILTVVICCLSFQHQPLMMAITKSPLIMTKCLGSYPMSYVVQRSTVKK